MRGRAAGGHGAFDSHALAHVGQSERGIELGDPIELTIRDRGGMVRWVHTYAGAKSSELVLVVDSYGLLSIALDRRSAAAEHDLRIGTEVHIAPPPPGTPRIEGITTTVSISTTRPEENQ